MTYEEQRTQLLEEAAKLRERAENGAAARARAGGKERLIAEAERLERMAENCRVTGKWEKEIWRR